jgi:hypothetical protein
MGIVRKNLRNLALLLFLAVPAKAEVLSILDLGGGMNDAVPPHMIADNQGSEIVNFHVDERSRGLIQRSGNRIKNNTALGGGQEVDPFTYVQDDRDVYLLAKSSTSLYYSQDNGASWTVVGSTLTDAISDGSHGTDNKFYLVNQSDVVSFNGSAMTYEGGIPKGKYVERHENRLWVANTAANANRIYYSGILTMTTFATSTDYIDFPEPITAIGPPLDIGLPVYTENQVWIVRGKSTLTFNPVQISGTVGCAENRSVQNFYLNGANIQVFLSNGEGGSEKNLWAFNGVEIATIGDPVINTIDDISAFESSLTEIGWSSEIDFDEGTYFQATTDITAESIQTSTFAVHETETADWNSAAHYPGLSVSGANPIPDDGATTAFVNCVADSGYILTPGPSATYYSEIFDTGFSSANYTYVGYDYVGDPGPVSVYVRDSSTRTINSSDWNDWVLVTAGSSPTYVSNGSLWRRYFQYKIVWDENNLISAIQFQAVAATATYTSNVISAASSISQWQTVDLSTTGTKGTVYLRTGISEVNIATEPYVAITDGYDIPGANPFIQFKVEFSSITSPTDADQLIFNSLTATYLSASGAIQPMDSVTWNGEYWLSYTPDGESTNSKILVMNEQGAFSKFDGLDIAGFTIANNNIFGGDATSGWFRQLDFGVTDEGTAITATADLKQNPLQLNDWEKNVSLAYFDYKVDAGTFTVVASQNYGQRTKTYSLSAAAGTQYNRARLEVDPSTTMKYFGLEIENNYPSSSLRIYPPLNIHFTKVRLIPR